MRKTVSKSDANVKNSGKISFMASTVPIFRTQLPIGIKRKYPIQTGTKIWTVQAEINLHHCVDFKKLALAGQLFKKSSYSRFHENPTNNLVADILL